MAAFGLLLQVSSLMICGFVPLEVQPFVYGIIGGRNTGEEPKIKNVEQVGTCTYFEFDFLCFRAWIVAYISSS